MPAEPRKISAHQVAPHALLERRTSASALDQPLIAMQRQQLALAEHRLGVFDRRIDPLLQQDLTIAKIELIKLGESRRALVGIAHHPDAAAGGADRGLDHDRRLARGMSARRCHRTDNGGRRLRQAKFSQHRAKRRLVERGAIAGKARQR